MSKQAIYALSDGGSVRTRQEAIWTGVFIFNRFVLLGQKALNNKQLAIREPVSDQVFGSLM